MVEAVMEHVQETLFHRVKRLISWSVNLHGNDTLEFNYKISIRTSEIIKFIQSDKDLAIVFGEYVPGNREDCREDLTTSKLVSVDR